VCGSAWLAGAPQVDGHCGREEAGEGGGRAAPDGRGEGAAAGLGQRQGQRGRLAQRRLGLREHKQAHQQARGRPARVRGPAHAGTSVAQQEVVVEGKGHVRQTQHAHSERPLQTVLQRWKVLQAKQRRTIYHFTVFN